MKDTYMFCPLPDDMGTFDLAPADPLYHTERLSYYILYNMAQMKAQDFRLRQLDGNDISDWSDLLDGYFETTFPNWLDGAVTAQAEGTEVPTLPEPPSPPALPVPNSLVSIVVEIAIRASLWWIKKRFEGETETGELTHKIEELKDLFEHVFTLPSGL